MKRRSIDGSLLQSMRQLMRQEMPTRAVLGTKLPGAKENVLAAREGPCAELAGETLCARTLMDPDARKIGAETVRHDVAESGGHRGSTLNQSTINFALGKVI
jgi:hypothetical protein